MPALLQNGQRALPDRTVCRMCAGGTATTPRTRRVGRQSVTPTGTMMLPQTTLGVPDDDADATAQTVAARTVNAVSTRLMRCLHLAVASGSGSALERALTRLREAELAIEVVGVTGVQVPLRARETPVLDGESDELDA